ncbi:MAG: ABC transporter ATP-binding protein [Verrucomicrobiota bacterium]
MKSFAPYYKHLKAVKGPFAAGVAAGLIYAAASGAGVPLMIDVVFPILFHSDAQGSWYVEWMQARLAGISREQLLLIACLWIPAVFLIRGAAAYANAYLIQYTGRQVLESIRMDLFIHLQRLPLAFFKRNRAGDLLARLMQDADVVRQVIAQGSSDLIKQPATLLFAIGFLIYKSVTQHSFFISVIALASVPLCVMVIRITGKRLAARARRLQEHGGEVSATLTESLQSPLEIRAYNLEDRQIERFRSHVHELFRLSMKVVKYRQAISPSIEVVAAVGFALALFFGVRSGMSQEDFLSLGAALFMAYEPIKKLGLLNSLFRQGESAVHRMEFILHEPDDMPDALAPRPFVKPRESIRFDHVSFAYDSEPVLADVTLEIAAGSVVALIGPSGAGKSTFASLIPRFYDPTAGRILIDGTDVRDFTKSALRLHIAVVPQMPTLFSGTIAENIRIGRENASDEDIIRAAQRANADNFIRALPLGYATPVGERGDQLSGGQRQRIAIARAFLRDAPILILDEATSALDSESEQMVQQALADLVKGRTTFIIAHRFSTITIAGRILVFENGRVTGDGSHAELAAAGHPVYQAMQHGQVIG